MKILVTGASGFIGNHVINVLLQQNYKVYATSSNFQKASISSWLPKVSYHAYTIGEELNEADRHFFSQADAIIHLAWDGLPDFNSEKHVDIYQKKHLQFLSELSNLGLKRMCVVGTCLEYGLQEGELYEDLRPQPVTNYGIAKNNLRINLEQLDIQLTWIRLFYMFGQGQSPKSIIPQLAKAISEGKESFDMSDGLQERDYLPVEKVADYIVQLALSKNAEGIFNCSSGKPIKVRELVEEFVQKNNSNIQLNFGVYSYPEYEPVRFWGNNEKIRRLIEDDIRSRHNQNN
jgi:dTDP-6-deoxy-L-talose 4-dehydrogenase (NAD+)